MATLEKAKLDSKDVIKKAKAWLLEQYSGEDIANISLEEVRFDGDNWIITLGFDRARKAFQPNTPQNRTGSLADLFVDHQGSEHVLKIVTISDQTEEIISLTNREPY